jgi:hypothetical protein
LGISDDNITQVGQFISCIFPECARLVIEEVKREKSNTDKDGNPQVDTELEANCITQAI